MKSWMTVIALALTGGCVGCDSAVVGANVATVIGASEFIFRLIDLIGGLIPAGGAV